MSFYGTDRGDGWDEVPDPTVPVEPGHRALDDARAFLARFVAFPSDDALAAATLWAAHAHALDAFDCTPRLALLSPEPGSGKTRALEILELLVPRPLLTVNVTPAYLFRKVADEAGPPTLLYDEIDTVFGPKAKDNEDIRGMLNAGYRRGATAGRCVIRGKSVEVEELPAYAAVALAGLDDLPDTIMTRSVVVRMRRRAPHERVEPYRRRVHEADGHALRDRLAAFAARQYGDLDGAWPDLPGGIEDRNADVWEPLLAVADAAGGHWPDTARRAAVSLVSSARDNAGSLGVRLLADLRQVFTDAGADKLGTDYILEALHELEESPWADLRGKPLDARGLSRRLGKYEVKPKQVRLGERTLKGYDAGDLADAWSRYLSPEPVSHVSDVSPAEAKRRAGVPVPAPTSTKADPTHPGARAQTETSAASAARLFPDVGETSETPKRESCLACGDGLSSTRVAYGKDLCVDCEQAVAS